MGADPVNMVDPTGGRVPLPDDLPGRLYRSKDAAAWDWARQYIKYSLDNNVELASVIYEYILDGVKYYGYTQATVGPDPSTRNRESPGPEHFLAQFKQKSKEWDRSSLVPKGAKIVGHIHSHAGVNGNPGNINPSISDKKMMGQSLFSEWVFYLLVYNGNLKKYDPEGNEALYGLPIVTEMYRGKNSREKVSNDGNGVKIGDFESNSKLDTPLPNKILIGNSTSSQVLSDKQAAGKISDLIRIISLSNKVISTTIGLTKSMNIPKGLPCPIF